MTSLIGSSGIVSSASVIRSVSVSTNDSQSLNDRLYSGSRTVGDGMLFSGNSRQKAIVDNNKEETRKLSVLELEYIYSISLLLTLEPASLVVSLEIL